MSALSAAVRRELMTHKQMTMASTHTTPPSAAAGMTLDSTARSRTNRRQETPKHEPLTLSELERQVREKVGVDRAGPILSDARRMLRHLLMAERRVDETAARELLLIEDLRGPLLRAEEFARVQAQRAKRDAGAGRLSQSDINRTRRVAQVVSIVSPESTRQRSHRPVALAVPPAWKPVVDIVVGHTVAACAQRRHIEQVVAAFARSGIVEPAQLPTDADHLTALLVDEGLLKAKTIRTGISDLRSALRRCREAGTLPAETPVPAKRLGKRRVRGGAAWATDREAKLRAELPLWAEDLEEFLAISKESLGSMWYARTLATYRLAAGLCEMRDAGMLSGVDLRTLQMYDLGTVRVSRHGNLAPRVISRAAARNGQSASTDTVLLMEALGEHLTRVVRTEKPGRGVPPIVWQDIQRVWGIVTTLLRPSPDAPIEDRVRWQGANEAVQQWTAKAEQSRQAEDCERDKALLAEHLSLPQAIVFGIPFFTLVALPEAEQRAASQPLGSLGRRTATKQLERLLVEWVALSTKIADPLRVEQRAYGRVGREIEIVATFEPGTGLLEHITGVTTHFAGKLLHLNSSYGEGNALAGFKQHHKRARSWDWSPSIVDFRWLTRYFRDVWYPRVQTWGESGSMREAMTSGRWTLFPSTGTGKNPKHPWKGMADGWISEKTGEAMLRVLREALGYQQLPAVRKDAIQIGWRSLLSDHNGRHLWATYWGGLRATRGPRQTRTDGTVVESVSGMDYCRRATTDEEKTLRAHYVALTQTMQRLLTRTVGSWSHPLSLDALMDRASLTDHAVEWNVEWDRLAAVDGTDAMPPELRARWLELRAPASGRKKRRGR